MSNATDLQATTLRKFAEDRPEAWEVLERAGIWFANLELRVTDEYHWWVQLEPLDAEDSPYVVSGGHPAWRASCEKGSVSDHRDGSLQQCKAWIEDRVEEGSRERRVARELEDFAEGRRKWKFVDAPNGRHYVGRRFDYGVGEQVMLAIAPHAPSRRRNRFSGQVITSFSAGPESTILGDSIDYIADWVREWEKLLEVPLRLAEADLAEANEIVRKLRFADLARLAYLVDIRGGIAKMRTEMVYKFCPAARGRK